MIDDDTWDPVLHERLRRFSDSSALAFDPDHVAADAMLAKGRPARLLLAAFVATTVVAAAVALVVALNLASPERGSSNSSSAPTAAVTPSPSESPPLGSPPPIEPPPPSAAPGGGLTKSEAIAAARRAAPHAADYPEVIRADAGPFGTEAIDSLGYTERPADVRWVWVIILCDGCGPLSGHLTMVVLDYLDGRVYGIFDFIG